MERYTSKQILAMDELYDIQDSFCSCGTPFEYVLTEGERGWMDFIRGNYCIVDWIDENREGNILTFNDAQELSEALFNDGNSYKAVMLCDKTALQKLFLWLNIND